MLTLVLYTLLVFLLTKNHFNHISDESYLGIIRLVETEVEVSD